MIIQPYDDEEMVVDKLTGKYVLTAQALVNIGIEPSRYTSNSVNQQSALSRILHKVSLKIYGEIHKHNGNHDVQDYFILHVDALRPIIKEAMLIQAERILSLGNLKLSLEHADQDIDEDAKTVLGTTLKELCGQSILYEGRWEPWIYWIC